ncbi:hypothetical protein ACJX0J_009835, partial [Zea mays]
MIIGYCFTGQQIVAYFEEFSLDAHMIGHAHFTRWLYFRIFIDRSLAACTVNYKNIFIMHYRLQDHGALGDCISCFIAYTYHVLYLLIPPLDPPLGEVEETRSVAI